MREIPMKYFKIYLNFLGRVVVKTKIEGNYVDFLLAFQSKNLTFFKKIE